MNPRQQYLFDLNGYVLLKNVIPATQVKKINRVIERLEKIDPKSFPPNIVQSKPRTSEELYISNIVEADTSISSLIDLEPVIDIIEFVSRGLFRLNHSYSISHWNNSQTTLHMGGSPIHPKATYQCCNGEIFSCLTKAVFPIANHTLKDGCFAVVPGSHKSNFPSPFGTEPDGHPALKPLEVAPGDAIVFTEAITHGSARNVSGKPRRSIFLCYSVGYMPDWTKLNLRFSESFANSLDEKKKEIIRLKIT
jgi:ectoine hydroxylase-related dioxygenase (phytanoyl-CoA dioxygenase family)